MKAIERGSAAAQKSGGGRKKRKAKRGSDSEAESDESDWNPDD